MTLNCINNAVAFAQRVFESLFKQVYLNKMFKQIKMNQYELQCFSSSTGRACIVKIIIMYAYVNVAKKNATKKITEAGNWAPCDTWKV